MANWPLDIKEALEQMKEMSKIYPGKHIDDSKFWSDIHSSYNM